VVENLRRLRAKVGSDVKDDGLECRRNNALYIFRSDGFTVAIRVEVQLLEQVLIWRILYRDDGGGRDRRKTADADIRLETQGADIIANSHKSKTVLETQ